MEAFALTTDPGGILLHISIPRSPLAYISDLAPASGCQQVSALDQYVGSNNLLQQYNSRYFAETSKGF